MMNRIGGLFAVTVVVLVAVMSQVSLAMSVNQGAPEGSHKFDQVIPFEDMDQMVHNEELLNRINDNPESTWTAALHGRFTDMTLEQLSSTLGALAQPENEKSQEEVYEIPINIEDMPESFDARERWPKCKTISMIRDQGGCGSCWAVSAAETMSDRVCVHSDGEKQPYLSSEDLLSCCGFRCGMGCNGGYPIGAWSYFKVHGVVTGGEYNSHEGCMPYEIAPCEHHVPGPRPACGSGPTPRCRRNCASEYGEEYSKDKYFGEKSYYVPSTVEAIKKEILVNGPVQAAFSVYDDFPLYKSGVYQQTSSTSLGGHAVRIVGWGVEKGVDYWLVANSWNYDWGDHGFFKIKRGSNECGIEGQIVAGIPRK
eukprot:Nk52_evm21s223 gene=Nk52_evmTU21s223